MNQNMKSRLHSLLKKGDYVWEIRTKGLTRTGFPKTTSCKVWQCQKTSGYAEMKGETRVQIGIIYVQSANWHHSSLKHSVSTDLEHIRCPVVMKSQKG